MGAAHPWHCYSPKSMVFVENFRSIPSLVSRSLLIIISYLPALESSTWHFHVTIFIALRTGKDNYTFTIQLFVVFPACVLHFVEFTGLNLFLSFWVIRPLTIEEVHPLYNSIRKLLLSDLCRRTFIQPCIIGEWWFWIRLVILVFFCTGVLLIKISKRSEV